MIPVNRKRAIGLLVLIALLSALLFSRWLPHNGHALLVGDSSMFLFIGQQIDHGLLPYVDVWDHKPPLVFYLDALSLRMMGGSPVGAIILGYILTFIFLILLGLTVYEWSDGYSAVFSGPISGLSQTSPKCFLFPFRQHRLSCFCVNQRTNWKCGFRSLRA